jgi:hypothetical protein
MNAALKKELGRYALAGAAMGLVIVPADNYWGRGDGVLAAWVLALFLLGGLLFDFFSSAQSLMQPRRLDLLFVCGADYARRKSLASRDAIAASWRQAGLPVIALLALGAFKGLRPAFLGGVAALFCVESLLVTSALLLAVRLEWLPVSARKFTGEGAAAVSAFGGATASFFLKSTHASARVLAAWMPAPYAWIIRRKLLYLFRIDTVFVILYVFFLSALGAQLDVTWSVFACAIFSLAGAMVSLTLVQIASDQCEDLYGQCAYMLPLRRFNRIANLLLSFSIVAIFSAYFAASTLAHQGMAAGASQGFWQVLITGAAFPFLLAEKEGARKTPDARVVLNIGYLGISGVLFMFPVFGIAAAALGLAAAAFAWSRWALKD